MLRLLQSAHLILSKRHLFPKLETSKAAQKWTARQIKRLNANARVGKHKPVKILSFASVEAISKNNGFRCLFSKRNGGYPVSYNPATLGHLPQSAKQIDTVSLLLPHLAADTKPAELDQLLAYEGYQLK